MNGSDQTEAKARLMALKSKEEQIEPLEHRLSTLYEDRLDGRCTSSFFDQKATLLGAQQDELRRSIAEIQNSALPPLTTAVEIARLTSHACSAFRNQTEPEHRKLLTKVLKDAAWKDGQLQTTLFEPFDQVRRSNQVSSNTVNGLALGKRDFEIWLPSLDSN